MFILNSIGIFVKLIQEYRGGPIFIQVGNGCNFGAMVGGGRALIIRLGPSLNDINLHVKYERIQ